LKLDDAGWDNEIDLGDLETPKEEAKKGWPEEEEIDLGDLEEKPAAEE
jgi:hypothetical protein